jgi:hypothetical protein
MEDSNTAPAAASPGAPAQVGVPDGAPTGTPPERIRRAAAACGRHLARLRTALAAGDSAAARREIALLRRWGRELADAAAALVGAVDPAA